MSGGTPRALGASAATSRAGLALLVLAATMTSAGPARAQVVPPAPRSRISDEAGVLSEADRQEALRLIWALERDVGAEVGVLVARRCPGGGDEAAAWAVKVFNQWRIGKAGRDNGVLLLLLVDDRAVEICPGRGYRDLFDRDRSTGILDEQVVPHLRDRGRERWSEAVLAGVREVARQVRIHERAELDARDLDGLRLEVEAPFGGAGRAERGAPPPAPISPTPVTPAPRSRSRSRSGGSSIGGILLGNPFGGLLCLLGVPAVIAAAIFLRPKCPRCSTYLRVVNRTLVSATYTSSGRGESTRDCPRCGHHDVHVYTIAQLQHRRSSSSSRGFSSSSRSSSRSSSSRSSGGSSFGGGRSSGGGGGRRF